MAFGFKPQQMAIVTMVAAVISAFVLVLPLLGVALPTRVGAAGPLSCWNFVYDFSSPQTDGQQTIPRAEILREIQDSQSTIVHKGFGPIVCDNMRMYVVTEENGYNCQDAMVGGGFTATIAMDIGPFKGEIWTKEMPGGEVQFLWHQCERLVSEKSGHVEFWVYP